MNRFVFMAALICATPAYAETAYFAAIEGLPLAPGLEEAGPGTWFDDANGRTVNVIARGQARPAEVCRFYLDTLPALGWSFSPGAGADGELVFLRERERLALAISPRGGGVEVDARLFIRAELIRAD